jgi:hypothetical protein
LSYGYPDSIPVSLAQIGPLGVEIFGVEVGVQNA